VEIRLQRGRVYRRIQRRGDSLPLPRQQHPDPLDHDTGSRRHRRLTNGQDTWRARCGVIRTAGSAGGSGKRTGRKTSTAPWPDPAHDNHGGNVQVVTAPDGWPLWSSQVRPGREHDTTALRTHTEILPALAAAGTDLRTLGDLGYEGESDTITVGFKKPKGGKLSAVQKQFNKAHNGLRAIGERGNSLLKMTFRALRNVSLDPWRIGNIVAAALVLLHVDHGRTT
jgi:hypothetical protein